MANQGQAPEVLQVEALVVARTRLLATLTSTWQRPLEQLFIFITQSNYPMSALLASYKPKAIKVLFIAEAAGFDSSGNLIQQFYFANNNLFRTIFTTFEAVFGAFGSLQDFLDFFRSTGCYLDHLSLVAVDRSDRKERQMGRRNAVPSLSERLESYQPEVIIVLMKDIQKQMAEALDLSGITSVRLLAAVPYPAGSDTNRQNCIAEIADLLRSEEVRRAMAAPATFRSKS